MSSAASSTGTGARGRVYGDLLRRHFLPQWPSAAALVGLVLAIAAIRLAQPRILAAFMNVVTSHAGLGASGVSARVPASDAAASGVGLSAWPLLWLAVSFLVLAAAGQALAIAEAFTGERLALAATNRVRSDLLLHCLRLDVAFHHAHPPGELVERVDGDVGRLANFFSRFLVQLVSGAVLLTGSLVMLGTVDWRVALGLTAVSAAAGAALYRMRSAGADPRRPHRPGGGIREPTCASPHRRWSNHCPAAPTSTHVRPPSSVR